MKIECPYCSHKEFLKNVKREESTLVCGKCSKNYICYGGGYSPYSIFNAWEYHVCKIEEIGKVIDYLSNQPEDAFSEKYPKEKTIEKLRQIEQHFREKVVPEIAIQNTVQRLKKPRSN